MFIKSIHNSACINAAYVQHRSCINVVRIYIYIVFISKQFLSHQSRRWLVPAGDRLVSVNGLCHPEVVMEQLAAEFFLRIVVEKTGGFAGASLAPLSC